MGLFLVQLNMHIHQLSASLKATQIRAKTSTEVQRHSFIRGSQIVESTLHEHLDPEAQMHITAEAYGFSWSSEQTKAI